jgi:MFS family permease
MKEFWQLLRSNPNYRYTWIGQVISEMGDYFNTIAVFSLALQYSYSGLAVTGVLLSRAIPAILAGPLAGVLLDRLDRKRVMLISDLVRGVTAAGFLLTLREPRLSLLFLFSGLLMFASPFFTSGRAAILPTITTPTELHAANSLTQTTQWTSLTVGTVLGGFSVAHFGFAGAFLFNSLSFFASACCIWRLRVPAGHFRAPRKALTETSVARPWHEYKEGLRYMKSTPLILAIGLVHVGWSTGGGAAQVLFPLFGELVFHRGAAGTGEIWSMAGVGLLVGGAIGHKLGRRLNFAGYKRTIMVAHALHGIFYVCFSQMRHYGLALLFISLSRVGMGLSSVLNYSQLLRHVRDEYRGRVFSTIESMVWSTMMLSMTAAGIASQTTDARSIGAAAGVLSSMTAVFWGWANARGKLPEPPREGVEPEEIEIHGDPRS